MFYEFLPANIQNKMKCASFCFVFLSRRQKYNNRTQQLVVLKKLYTFVEKIWNLRFIRRKDEGKTNDERRKDEQ